YPCVIEHAPGRSYIGHASHVMGVRFSPDNNFVMSVGGDDRSCMQWKVLPIAHDDVTVDAPLLADYAVYKPPKREALGEAPPLVIPAAPMDDGGEARRNAEKEAAMRANMRKYEIVTTTSNIKGAGTDCGVFLQIYGDKKASGQVVLENGPDNFSKGKVDKFLLDLPVMGTLQRMIVGQDEKGNMPRWHLESVSVQNKTDNEAPVMFHCGQWLARDVGDGRTVRTLTPGSNAMASRRYKVSTRTSDIRGAGTDANVYITLFGEGPDGKPVKSNNFPLDNSANNFERNQTDTFDVEAMIGDLKYIQIGHDNTGTAPGWHLQDVAITSPGMADMQFVANRWLDVNEGDKQTYVLLYPGAGAEKQIHEYRIHAFTSDIRGAGTDANVTIVMFGDAATGALNTGRIKLDSSKNDFERGNEDIFYAKFSDLGEIPEVEIEHDNSGPGPGWHCQEIVVFDLTADNKRMCFPCDQWLATDEGDGLIRRRLTRLGGGGATNYRINVYTSDVRGAGTDANVYIYLSGVKDGQELWGPKHMLDTSKNNFERNMMDTFLLSKHRSLGALKSVKIGHDNSGLGPGWHLDHVEVVDNATGEEFYFPCDMWFDKGEGDRLIERTLAVAPKDARAEKAQYKISVHTSDIKFAGTDANVHIQIMGMKRMDDGTDKSVSTDKLKLNSSKNDFERASVDIFTITATNVGDMKSVRIGHDDSGIGAAWHLKMVEVMNITTGELARFMHNGWLSKDEPPHQIEVELWAEDEEKPPDIRYTVTVYTSDIRGAGTDANVDVMMYGDKRNSPLLRLDNSKDNFERAMTDECVVETTNVGKITKLQFVVETTDVGKITKLQVGQDDSGIGAAWHLEHVEIFNQVSVQTGDARGAGTDADVSVIMLGEKATSAEMKLDNSKNNFERSKLDEFTLNLGAAELGELKKLEIGFSTQQSAGGKVGGMFGKDWHLTSVEVVHLNTGDRKFFMYDDWINDTRRRVQLVPGVLGVNNTYKVVVKTSDIRGAGTDANVSLVIHGTKDGQSIDTGSHKLDDSKNNFERNMKDVFMLKTKDCGELTRVVVTSDGAGFGGAWHLEEISVLDTVRGVETVFPCGEWLEPKDPMSLCQTLLPRGVDGSKGSLLQYDVTVYTSDIRGAGTDADIFLEMWGDKDHTSGIRLDTSANDFERGSKDTFKPKAIDVGELQHIIVRKAETMTLGGDWHLQEVEIWHPATQKRYCFLHNDWLKGKCEVKLEVGKVPANGRCTYRCVVYTADERGAGTDANVSMALYGDKGDTGENKLDTSANDFERGNADTFFVQAPDVGRFQKLIMTQDNSGFGAAWKLAKVEITNTNSGESCVFPCNRWLDKKTGLSVTLTPDRDGDGLGDALEGGTEAEYTVAVYTSDLRGAGTNANVFLELHGDKAKTGERRLDDDANNFERNRRDVFKFKASDVGNVEKVVIRHDNAGLSSDWHLQQIEVTNHLIGKTFFFSGNCWLKKIGDDETGLRKELFAGSADGNGPTNYRIEVVTSDIRGAGTDADVSIVVYGEKGDTGDRKLDAANVNDFERGNTDVFFVTSSNVGAMQKIKIKSTGSGLGAAWHLARVVVTSSATGETLPFPFNNWVDKQHGLEHIIWPDRDGDGLGDVGPGGALLKYKVNVFTSDIRGAGTDANVFIEIHGDKAFVGATKLETRANNFERGAIDQFEVVGSDVGIIEKIVIGHDNSGLGAAWHCAQVEVFHPVLQQMLTFPCDEWLQYDSKKGGADNCKRKLLTGAAAAWGGFVTYKVMVKTSDIRGAGTDSDVFLTIMGPKGDTGEQELDASGRDDFERGKLDHFVIKGPDVGEPDRIKIRSDGSGLGDAWHLEKIDVISSATNQSYAFLFANWIDKEHGLEHYIYRDGVQGSASALQDYKISVYTSDVRGAGTDANVFVELYGSDGTIGRNSLETHGNNFERGNCDVFVVKGTAIGDIEKVVIWHDNKGLGAAWHLQQVDVFNPATQRTYCFPCNEWLEGDDCKKTLMAGQAAGGKHTYKVEVKTSDVRGAGTDSNVSIQVFGTKGDTGAHNLDDSKNNFERDMLDNFFFEAPDIGDIRSALVKCDGKGLGAAWHLDSITVTNAITGAHGKFVYQNWFDDKTGWAQSLYPEGVVPNAAAAGIVPFRISVFTSDVRGAGTDGEVFISMKGEWGDMGETELSSGRDNFSRAKVDVFEVMGSDIGPVKEVTVRLKEAGIGAAWHFKQVEVLNKKSGQVYRFIYDNWLEESEENPRGAVTLKEAGSDDARLAGAGKVTWRVTTQTSNIFGAGTDANVFIKLWGPAGMLGGSEINLDNSKNNFERGMLDTFFLEFPVEQDCSTPISKLVIECGNQGLGADWHLDWIEVTDVERGHNYKWRCGHWFDKTEGQVKEWSVEAVMAGQPVSGQKMQLELVEAPAGPEKPVGSTPVAGEFYKFDVHTSTKFQAGTDATVRLALTDVAGQTWQPTFMQDSKDFQKGMVAHLEASSLFPLGELASLRVWLDEATIGCMGDGWHLDHIDVTHLPSQRAWRFGFANWLPKGGALIAPVITNDVSQATIPGRPDEESRAVQHLPPPPPPIEYGVTVFTSDKMSAGTDATVTMEVVGSWSRAIHVFDQAKGLFEKGGVDRFTVRIPDCGALESVRFWHDGGGMFSGWHLARVQVDSAEHACTWAATFNAWVSKGEGASILQPLQLVAGQAPTGPPPPPPPPGVKKVRHRPGDPGIHPAVLPSSAFNDLPAMQRPEFRDPKLKPRILRDPSMAQKEPPPCDWQEHTTPHAANPDMEVTYYHNMRTSESTYDKPPELQQHEDAQRAFVRSALGPGGGDSDVPPVVPDQFNKMSNMQPGDLTKRMSHQAGAEPTCDWQQFSAPHPQDPGSMVKYYHNARTGESRYDAPPEYVAWEAGMAAWVASAMRA
ncbi:hypothetical protein FOA52_002840, partial [Chlamydomonas sp. UWO 241]